MALFVGRKRRRCTPKQWIGFCNTFLLFLVALLCSLVILEIYHIDQRFISILDSSSIAIDVVAVESTNPKQSLPIWKLVAPGVQLYSAFYAPPATHLLILGSTSERNTQLGLQCLVEYDSNDISVSYASYEVLGNCSTFLIYCSVQIQRRLPQKVTLLSSTSTIPKAYFKVNIVRKSISKRSMAACILPTQRITSDNDLATFLAFQEVIGVEHFYVYNNNISLEAVEFVEKLISVGYPIDILPWNTKSDASCNVPFSVLVQDCVHRAMSKHTHTILLDIFDFFVTDENTDVLRIMYNIMSWPLIGLHKSDMCPAKFESGNYDEFKLAQFGMLEEPKRQSETNFILSVGDTAAVNYRNIFSKMYSNKSIYLMPTDIGFVRHHDGTCGFHNTWDLPVNKILVRLEGSVAYNTWRAVDKVNKNSPTTVT